MMFTIIYWIFFSVSVIKTGTLGQKFRVPIKHTFKNFLSGLVNAKIAKEKEIFEKIVLAEVL